MPPRSSSTDAAWGEYAAALALNLRRIRMQRGMSQEDVAYRSGLTRYTYQKYEKGESRPGAAANPTLRTLIALTQALDISLSQLLPASAPDLLSR